MTVKEFGMFRQWYVQKTIFPSRKIVFFRAYSVNSADVFCFIGATGFIFDAINNMKDVVYEKRTLTVTALSAILIFFSLVYREKGGANMIKSDSPPTRSNDEVLVQETVTPVSAPEQKAKEPNADNAGDAKSVYPVHKNITATLFWVGEEAGEENRNISNVPSAWDGDWVRSFGGVDDPKKRSGYRPSKFVPRENPFYFALPYGDFYGNGSRKENVVSVVPWAKQDGLKDGQSVLKNRWIKITKNGKSAYAQWEDVGPFEENDAQYVFGNAEPKNKENNQAGLDVSPAVNDFLDIKGMSKVDWQFIDANQVPSGPWKDIVTTSQLNWK